MLRSFIHTFFAAFVLSLSSFAYGASDYHVENQPQVIEEAIKLQQRGILKQKDNGYLYLEVSKDFIAKTLPLIEAPGKIIPPHHYTSRKGIGAHISVMYENEQILNEIWEIAELGQEFEFTVSELRTVKINSRNKMKKLWLISVEAPQLVRLRQAYGLPQFIKDHDFHITLGSQIPGKPEQAEIVSLEKESEFEQAM